VESKRTTRTWTLAVVLIALAITVGTVSALSERDHPEAQAVRPSSSTSQPVAPDSPATVPYTTLVDVLLPGPETLDPHWMYDTTSQRVAFQVYEALLMHEREDPVAWAPLLATGWQISGDGKTYTFSIRQGVAFHAGGTLEPHDVAYSFWRALLQDRDDGPASLLLDPLFGVYDVESLPGDDAAKCQTVKDAITYDDGQKTVTFHLPDAFGPFLDVLASSVGMVVDQEWMAANGDWGGSCTNWRTYHNPPRTGSLLYDRMNGTGPFQFIAWTADEIKLVRFDGYWRRQPAWPGGPAGPAPLEAVVFKYVADWETRRDMLTSGEADTIYVPGANRSELEPFLWGVYEGFRDPDPSLVHPVTGTLRLYKELPWVSQTPLLFYYSINTDSNPYIGSGALDGNGIPPDFFTDLHVRKAFKFAMDWSAVISDAYTGEAIRSRGPIPAGELGYTDTQPVYPYSPTLSIQEFQQAWGGVAWSQGFSMTLLYSEGNTTRQRMLEILAQNIEALSSKFHVNVVGKPLSEYNTALYAKRLPLAAIGWTEDYHHPHNWVQPYLHSEGVLMRRLGPPPALAALFDAKVEACVALSDLAAAQTCYEELQNMSYENAMAMWGVQPLAREYLRTEVRGYYSNPAISFPSYYALSKGAPPTVETVSPTVDSTLNFAYASGATTTVQMPAGAVSETSAIVFTPDVAVAESHPGGFRLAGLTFDLQVCQGGECLPSYAFDSPVTATLHYQDADVAGVIEEELYLYTWNGSAWVDAVLDCGWPLTAYQRFPEENRLVVPLCHLTHFALVGGMRNAYLPLVVRNK
jgi:peptide/nickel transport system substrate-binding protein